MANLHFDPPMTVARVHAAHRWILPTAAVTFVALALGAAAGWLAWDEPITRWVVHARTPWLNDLFRRISILGSTPVVLTVSTAAAAVAWRRCPRLALAIIVIALARPLAEWALKELVSRDRPTGDRLVGGLGYSFPSGHPMAAAASWGVLPLVVALYTARRRLWWSVAIGVWVVAVLVAISRVWLGVHWTSDVIAGLLLALLGVAGAERAISARHGGCGLRSGRAKCDNIDEQVVDRPVLETTAQLPAVRLVERRREHRAEPPVALVLDRTGDISSDLEPAREHQRVHHLLKGLTRFGALRARVDDQRDARRRIDVIVGRLRRVAQRGHTDQTDREAHNAESHPGRPSHHA
jgi:undecaprenyl-diphosphatase